MKRPASASQSASLKEVVNGLRDHFSGAIKASGAAAAGEGGFEGLVARLLAAQTGLPFVTASSGLQPTGDAQDSTGRISVQCKAYFGGSNPSVVEIQGDANVQMHANEDLEVYILVLRKATTQINNLSAQFGEHGLDFVCIQCVEDHPELPCLLARHWDVVNDHPLLDDLPQHTAQNVVALTRDESALVDRTLVGLDKRIEHALGTYELCRSRSHDYLKKRFFSNSQGPRVGLFPIDLTDAIPRPESSKGIRDWWKAGSAPFIFLEGEEGCGKSWLIAQEAWSIAHAGQAVVFWLDSNQWAGADTLQAVLFAALRYCASISDTETGVLERFYRKILNRWRRPVLLVLDGMNERDCATSATNIVTELVGILSAGVGDDLPQDNAVCSRQAFPLRIVFTTRPRAIQGNPSAVAGDRGARISVPAYTDSEFAGVLSSSSLSQADVPTDAGRILRIPRLFSVFLRVKDLIPKSQVITPALIWWYDLIQKVRNGLDPAITNGLALHDPRDAEDLLCKVVKSLGNGSTVSSESLTGLFSQEYPTIRDDLAESRLFRDASRTSATISDDHVTLAWGLILFRFLGGYDCKDVPKVADEILKILEPGVSDPRRTDGILVAIQLSVTEPSDLPDEAIAAGVLAWFCSHNIRDRQEHLDFWCRRRLQSYVQFVEHLLASPAAGAAERTAVAPLARYWRGTTSQDQGFAALLRRWLLVTWCEGQATGATQREWAGIQLPVIPHREQLRLTPIAISVLSQRPDVSMLPALAECFASAGLSTAVHGKDRYPAKWPHDMLEALLKWGYTEEAIPVLSGLRHGEFRTDIVEAYEWLVTHGMGIRDGNAQSGVRSVEDAIVTFGDPRAYNPKNPHGWTHGLGALAVRDDLPSITDEPKAEMLSLFKSCCTESGIDRWFFTELWPWALRWDPVLFEEVCAAPLCRTLASDGGPNYEIITNVQSFLWRHQVSQIGEAINTCTQRNKERLNHFSAEMLFEWLLSHGTAPQIQEYLDRTENLRSARGHLLVNVMSTTELLRVLKPECVRSHSERQSRAIGSAWLSSHDAEEARRLEYWLLLWANTAEPCETTANWAVDLLLQGCPNQCRYDCTRLLARAGASRLPELIRANPGLLSSLKDEDFINMFRHGHLPDGVGREVMRLWFDSGSRSLEYRGRLLLSLERYDEFSIWGHELFELTSRCLSSPLQGNAQAETRYELDANGHVVLYGPHIEHTRTTTLVVGTNTWGHQAGSRLDATTNHDEAVDHWHDDEDALRKWLGFPLRDFCDDYVIQAWADRHPSEFLTLCRKCFDTLGASPEALSRLGTFPYYMLTVMLRWNPKEAYAYWEKVRSVSKNSVTVHGLDYFLYRAWSSSLNDVVGIADVRRASLRCAENDEIIMGLAICSAELGTDATLLGFCKELLTSKLSKDRALAVSALAWLWQDPVDGLLTELRDADPCCWVREHAKWALQVRRQDSACRRSYRRALETTDEYEVSRELNIMKSALLPSCVVWRDLEEKAAGFPAPDCSRRKEALVRHFWSHWDSVTNHRQDTQVLGRRIKQYQRGHKVDSQTEGLMAPWWKP